MRSLWTAKEAEAATGGRSTADWQAKGVSIDSRSLSPGDLFVALTDQRDGHDFVAKALASGAAAALVSYRPDNVPEGAPLLIVPDVMAALVAMGRAARVRSRARIVAITGSVGKTSTKEMLRLCLASQGSVHVAEASYNNHWGVPLTLARLPQDIDFAVVEIGMNHPGEIAPLARMTRPHAALITAVAPAHLAAFPSVEAIAQEKASIFQGLVQGGQAIVNADLPTTPILVEAARLARVTLASFGSSETADWRLIRADMTDGATKVEATANGRDLCFTLHSPGRHFALNALGALASVAALGADPFAARTALADWRPLDGRGSQERIDLGPGGAFVLINDAYNANPVSLAAALDILIATIPARQGRRIAILGDMLELGAQEMVLHAAVAGHPGLDTIARIHCVGPRMRALHDALPNSQRGEWVAEAGELAARARTLVRAGDVVLVKGSNGSRVGLVVDALHEAGRA